MLIICVGQGDTNEFLRAALDTFLRRLRGSEEFWLMFRLQLDDGEVACVAISDRVRPEDVSQTLDPLESLLGTGLHDRKVLLDLSGLKLLDSTGFCWLVQQNRRMCQSGGLLVLHSASPQLSQTLHRLKMELLFHIATDRESAIRLARSFDRDAATMVT